MQIARRAILSSGVASDLDGLMLLKLGTQRLNVHGNELDLEERVVIWQWQSVFAVSMDFGLKGPNDWSFWQEVVRCCL